MYVTLRTAMEKINQIAAIVMLLLAIAGIVAQAVNGSLVGTLAFVLISYIIASLISLEKE